MDLLKQNQQDATLHNGNCCYIFYMLLYILLFHAVSPPIIRSSKLYTQDRVFVGLFLLLTAIVSELKLQFQLNHDSGKKQKKPDKYPMLYIQF